MAFLHPIEIEQTGVTAHYWRLTHLQADFCAGIVEAKLHGFLDEAARLAGKSPLSVLAFRMPAASVMRDGAFNLAEIYAALRAMAAGEDAQGEPLPPIFAKASDI